MKIVRAELADLEALLRLERELPEAPHWAAAEYLRIVAAPGTEPLHRCLLLCRTQPELLGFAVGKVLAGEAELETVAVRPSARRKGVGKALCAAVITWAWEHGAATIDLEVRASSAGARALYASLGFVEAGRRPGYYVEPPEDAVLMRLSAIPPHPIG